MVGQLRDTVIGNTSRWCAKCVIDQVRSGLCFLSGYLVNLSTLRVGYTSSLIAVTSSQATCHAAQGGETKRAYPLYWIFLTGTSSVDGVVNLTHRLPFASA